MNKWAKLWLPELNPAQHKLLENKINEIIGDNVDTQSLVNQGRRQEAKEAFAINREKELMRERAFGKPEPKDNRWWLKNGAKK